MRILRTVREGRGGEWCAGCAPYACRDVVAELAVASLPAFDQTLRRIREVEGITVTETSILLASRKGAGVG